MNNHIITYTCTFEIEIEIILTKSVKNMQQKGLLMFQIHTGLRHFYMLSLQCTTQNSTRDTSKNAFLTLFLSKRILRKSRPQVVFFDSHSSYNLLHISIETIVNILMIFILERQFLFYFLCGSNSTVSTVLFYSILFFKPDITGCSIIK